MFKMHNIMRDKLNYDRIVSTDTCNPDHLLPVFRDTLAQINEYLKAITAKHASEYFKSRAEIIEACNYVKVNTGHLRFADEVLNDLNSDDPVMDQDATQNALIALFDCLDMVAADGYYFGSIEGDGACYGFFAIEEDDQE